MAKRYNAKYIVTLTPEERQELLEMVQKGTAAAYKIKHANILLASDENSENLSADKVAHAYHCHRQTVYDVRKRFVERAVLGTLDLIILFLFPFWAWLFRQQVSSDSSHDANAIRQRSF